MRVYKVRYDILICMILSALVVLGVVKILPGVYTAIYNNYVKMHTVADGEIGGAAGEDVYRAESVEDLLSHDTFTVEISYDSYLRADVGHYGDVYLQNLELPSGERVAACVNEGGAQRGEDDSYLLPVGRVVYADLASDSKFLGYFEKYDPLTRTDFYLDMEGKGSAFYDDPEDYDEKYTIYIKAATAVVSFGVIHLIGSKLGLFPSFFRRKKER